MATIQSTQPLYQPVTFGARRKPLAAAASLAALGFFLAACGTGERPTLETDSFSTTTTSVQKPTSTKTPTTTEGSGLTSTDKTSTTDGHFATIYSLAPIPKDCIGLEIDGIAARYIAKPEILEDIDFLTQLASLTTTNLAEITDEKQKAALEGLLEMDESLRKSGAAYLQNGLIVAAYNDLNGGSIFIHGCG